MHKIHLEPKMAKTAAVSEEPPPDADQVYVLLTDRYRISRNIRAQWYLQTLNTIIRLEDKKKIEDCENEIDIISIYSTYTDATCPIHRDFRITPTTEFKFFSRKYSFVYIIDLSTSLTNVDVHHSTVLTDEILPAITKCLKCLSEPLIVPGSKFFFEPEIYISIIVYSPFYSGDFNSVIIHGYKLCRKTYKHLFDTLKLRLNDFMEDLKLNIENEGTRLECANFRKKKKSNIVSADKSLVNMIRFGLLTLNLLPKNCHEGMIIVTDGDFSFPDSKTLESALGQLRLGMISCSFIQIGSPAHPYSSFGHVPYNDFMKFFSKATFGAYLSISPDYNCFPLNQHEFNVFHKAFFIWSFQYDCSSFYQELHGLDYKKNIWSIENPYFYSTCDDYDSIFGKDQLMIRQRQNESILTASLAQILTYRLREGFTIKRVHLMPNDNRIEILLVLPWRHSVNIEYNIISTYHPESADDEEQREITYEIIVEGSYSFLHDATCSVSNKKHGIKSIYRNKTIEHFWNTLNNFGKSDQMSIHFHNFAKNELHRSMPESVKKGVPLFYLPPNSQKPEVQFVNEAHSRFSNYWRQICLLDMNTCQRSSLHTFQVNFILRHDSPLPEFLYQPNATGRYDNIQCNQAMSVLNVMLKDWCSFVLLENHSYIKLIGETCSATCSFYLVRIVSQPPCVVLHLAFIGGTSSCLRNQIINELNLKLKKCKFPQRNLSAALVQNQAIEASKIEEPTIPPPPNNSDETKSSPLPYFTAISADTDSSNTTEVKSEPKSEDEQTVSQVNFKVGDDSNPPTTNPSPVTTDSSNSNNSSEKRTRNQSGHRNCFILLSRPIERMLVRYERVPRDFFTCYKYEENLKSVGNSSQIASLFMFQTLTRYLCHKRFIWYTHSPPHTSPLNVSAVSKILTVLTMKRLNEGFSLAYNEGGIVNLVMEVKMRDKDVGVESPCLVQYIIFPSTILLRNKESISIENEFEEEGTDNSGDHLLVTECWVEPKNGQVVPSNENELGNEGAPDFLQDADFDQISLSFFQSDKRVINCLLTYEQLLTFTNYDPTCPMCPNDVYDPLPSITNKDAHHPQNPPPPPELLRFNSIPYNFELLELLRLSQQALIKFSMLYQTFDLPANPAFDQPSQMSDCANMLLYSEFLLKLLHVHDKELEFSHADSVMFIEMVNRRTDKLSSPDQDKELFFSNFHLLIANPNIRFKCYCKQISPHCLMLTLLPFSYKVVRQLSFIGEGNIVNKRLISELEDDDGQLYGVLAVPILVYKITFNNLSQVLLQSTMGNELLMSDSWNLYYDYTLPCNKFYHQINTPLKKPIRDEIPLEEFCKDVEILFWNSFIDSVYKSLQYGFEIDDRDKSLVMEKISLKSTHSIEMTDFFIYTCKHLKPLVNSYLERFPGHCINDLIDYILGHGREKFVEHFELLKLKDVFSSSDSCANCHPNSEALKSAFVSYIQTHFTLIPGLASNYYFFDYENIQNINYRPGGDERAEKRKEDLLNTYRSVESDETNLGKLMLRAKEMNSKIEGSELGDVDITNVIKDEDEVIEEQDIKETPLSSALDKLLSSTFILSKPFFVNFSYSFTFKNGPQILKNTSIPTCLCELFTAKNELYLEEIKLENLRVKLNIEIITQNLEPIYEKNKVKSERVSVVSNESQLESGDFYCIIKNTLDDFQLYKYREFVTHIQYMIRDEVVNISQNSFLVSARTLDMVVAHIRTSKKSQTYSQKMDKVELKFIVEEDRFERCLGQLKDMLSELSLPDNFKLIAMGDYFYVVLNKPALIFTSNQEESFERQNCLVFNEELFEDNLQYEMSKIVSEYTIEGNQSSNLSPNFWLILTFDKTDAWMYFHSNHSIYLYGSSIFDKLRRSIEMLVKKINQIVLLERLDETRECEDLLITVEDKDPYTKANIRSALNSTPVAHLSLLEPELEMTEDKNFKLVKKNFAPGSFACSVVWEKHFPLHPRLHGKDGMSAIRSVLSSFTVTNRNNLYVYKEKSGSIFYLRIYEIECTRHLFNDSSKFSYALSDTSSTTMTEELASEIDTCYYYDNIITCGDCSINDSMHRTGDSDRDTDSIASFSNSPLKPIDRMTQCILLNVHGVTEPGVFIKDDMVMALQKKLDEAVLDNLILTLTRNPLSKFTYEDVCFIQSQNSTFDNFYFVINENYMLYMTNIKAYIRQNLSTLMSSPKYTDANPEFHFKLYKNDEFHCVLDEDVFILHCQQESGRDSRGVACVILSIVSKEKITSGLTPAFVLSKTDVNDLIFGNFDNITSCYSHQQENTNAPFYINFQIWSSGKIDTEEHLKKELINIIRQSLWDFNLEFNIFKMCSFEDSRNNFNSISEPTTPKKLSEKRERRSGLSIIQQTGSNFDDSKFFLSQQLWKRQDVSSPNTVNVTSSKKNYFDFEMNLDKVNDLSCNLQEAKNRELYSLSRTINIAVKPWLDFGSQKHVFSLKKYSFNIVQKNSVSIIIKEFNGFIPNFGGDMNVDILVSNPQNYCEFDLNSESTFEESNHLMILLRHEALWSAKYLHADMENSFTKLYHKLKNERAKLYFQPVFSTSKFWGNESSTNLNLSDSGRSIDDQWMQCIAPRQKFLLLFIEDRNIQLYLYNWSASHVTSIVGLFSNLIIWHNSRSLLQQSLILQKAGILHHLPFKRHSFEDILEMSKVKLKDLSLPSIINIHQHSFNKETPNMGSHIFKNTDMLLKHTNPLEAFKDFQQQKTEAQSRNDTIFDPKNYSFIFSSIESPSARNLFDCFNAQFNSHYNNYIRDLKDLSKIWQLHGSKLNSAIMEKITNYTKKYGRLSHFCLTPFLFSHKWRYSMAMIRDHTLPLGSGRDRSRHMSGGIALTKAHSIDHEFAPSTMAAASKRSRRKSGPPNMLEHSTLAHRVNMDECLDSAVCSNYIHEYVQYLQSLGFSSIKSQKTVPLVSQAATAAASVASAGSAKNSNFDQQMDRRPPLSGELRGQKTGVTFSSRNTSYSKNEIIKFYSIKTLPGGFFIFEIGFCEPYVYSYLYAFDLTRFSSWSKHDSFMAHMSTTNFLDELDLIKGRMHLHSFTYDYHMRAIHSYISGRQLFFHPGYHLISFLDDFIKYYQKAPNYARNHVYTDDIRFESSRLSADQLYKYITDNNKLYGLDVIEMNSSIVERLPLMANMNKECVLIQLSSHRIPYDDENNIPQEDNFDVGVLITNQKQPYNANTQKDYNNLCLKFFLLLTSQRELFPKLSPFGDSKGAFKPIRLLPTTSASNSQSRKNSVPKAPDAMEIRLPAANHPSPFSAYQRSPIAPTIAQNDQMSKLGYSGICDEKINYLGYFNAHEIVMGNILTQKVAETKEHLKRIITLAEIDCRRDRLWNMLIPNSSDSRSDFPISMEELNELLLLVKSIRLDTYDNTLSEFYTFNYSWYRSLAQKLELKFEFTHRKFIAKDNIAHCKMAFFKNNCKDCFILFELKNSVPFVDFKIVFKKPHETEIDYHFLQHCNPQYHELVEEFVNACTSHMWSAMMS